jgi:hypothetical protein
MRDERLLIVAAAALLVGALLGMAGSFAPSAELRGLFWGVDGTALVVGTALLAVHHLRRGNDLLAAAFLVYMVGETLMVVGASMELSASAPLLAAGTALWSPSLALASAADVMPRFVRVTGIVGSLMFAITAIQNFGGGRLTPLSRPLPFLAYPFLAATLLGWAWVHVRPHGHDLATGGLRR